MFRLLPIVSGLALLAALVPSTLADEVKPADWPQWRGVNRDDNSPDKGLLKEWPKDGPPLAWKYTSLGEGYSSVAVVGDKVFTMGDVDGSCHVIALSRDKGEKLWSAKVGKAGGDRGHIGPRGTPTVDADRVYVLGQFGDLVCLKVGDGAEVWRKSLPDDFKGRVAMYKYTESPLVDGDKVICTPGGKNAIVALNKTNGEVVWKSDADGATGYSSIVVSNAGGVKQYVQLLSGGVVGVDAKDGHLLWRHTKLSQQMPVIPTPIVLDDQVFCTAGYGKGGCLLTVSADSDGKLKAREEYFSSKLTNKHGGAVRVGDYIYGDTDDRGRLWCVEWKTGMLKDDWLKGASDKRGSGSASITFADGNLYVHYQNGYLALVPATPDGYQEKGSFKIPTASSRQSWSHPVVVDGKLYLREQDTLYVYDVKAK
jgi:outer membrane protein assembly factor BamB